MTGAIEILEFLVDPAHHQEFIVLDRAVWTAALATHPAFVDKQVWRDPQRPAIITVVIWWRDRSAWKAIAPDYLGAVGQEFDRQFPHPYQLVGERELEIL
jgi:uncharacterized protein (TIGR03792 family)